MSRQTSIEAYNAIKLSGAVKKLAFDVYHVLYHNGALTQGEVWQEHFKDHDRPTITPRFAELHRRGLIQPAGKRECRVTGVRCMTWDVTANMPSAQPATKSIKERLREAMDYIAHLERELKKVGSRPAKTQSSGSMLQTALF